ncbi:hypothetical protein V2J09_018601 [Rumex salicifolius]
MAVPAPAILIIAIATLIVSITAGDSNKVYSPCKDTTVQRHDGFTFGIAFSGYKSFFSDSNSSVQLSPCDKRLSLSSNAQVSVFRPKVDEISLLTIDNTSSLTPESYGNGFMVAFAGLKYAARSTPVFVGNDSYVVTSFTLVLEFEKGRLNNLYWKKYGCASCKGNSNFVCLNGEDCGLGIRNCTRFGGKVNCSPGIQLAFSGTDKHYQVLNSWYEVSKIRQYSLSNLYSNLKNSIPSIF